MRHLKYSPKGKRAAPVYSDVRESKASPSSGEKFHCEKSPTQFNKVKSSWGEMSNPAQVKSLSVF